MATRRKIEVGDTAMEDIALHQFHSLRQIMRSLNLNYDGEDLNLVYKLLGDAIVSFVGALTENGLPEEVNEILKAEGFSELVAE